MLTKAYSLGRNILKYEIFSLLRPFIPRRIQILIRRRLVHHNLSRYRHIWPIDQDSAKPPDGWSGWPEGKKFALVLTHDVETEKGLEKCHRLIGLEKRLGFKSSFNFVVREYYFSPELHNYIQENGFEVGIHGINHKENPFKSRITFKKHAQQINQYLKNWKCVGFRCPSMFHNHDYIHDLNVEYDSSTFDTDPFEPQPDGIRSIFPAWIQNISNNKGYVELPYTMPQDFLLFVLMKEKNIDIWKRKLDWIVEHGGMALLIAHPDYMNFDNNNLMYDEYPARYYEELLRYIKDKYKDHYWHVLPRDMAQWWKEKVKNKK